MKNPKKLAERWIKVSKISASEPEKMPLDSRGVSAGSIRSALTMKTDLDRGSDRDVASAMGWDVDGSPRPSELAGYSLDDFIDTVRDNSACLHLTDVKEAGVMHHLAIKGCKELIDHALNCGGDLTAQDCNGDTPLHWAVRGNSPDTIHTIMNAGADPTVLNKHKMAPLHLACDLDKPDIVEALCRHSNIDVNVPGEYGQSPLHYCALVDALGAAKTMLEYKARLCVRDNNGIFVIHCAATHASRKVLNLLLDKAEEAGYTREIVLKMKDKENNTALHSAVNSGSEEAVRVCIEFGSPLDILQEDDSTPLHLAASQGILPIVQLLLGPPESDKTLGMCDVEKMTPLHRAAMFDHVDVVEFLIEKGADIDAVDKSNCSPLLRAVRRGSFRTAKLLLNKYGADCNVRDCRNRNILHLAVQSGKNLKAYGLESCHKQPEIRLLLNNADSLGCTPIHYATRDGNIKCLQNLIEFGATVNPKNHLKQSPLHFAAKYGRFNSCKRLLDSSIGPKIINDIDGGGMTALHIAALNGHCKVIALLILRGALLHRDYKGRTPLHLAAMGGYLKSMKTLLTTHSYLLDQTDDNGDTALNLAARENKPSSVDFLLMNGAALLLNNDNQGLMSACLASNNEDVAQTVVKHDRGHEVFLEYVTVDPEALYKLIGKMPEVYKKMLDQSVTRSAEPPSSFEYWVRYDFKYLQRPLEERVKRKKSGFSSNPLCALNMVIEHDQTDILSHPVCVEYLNSKWKSYGLLVYLSSMALFCTFLGCLTFFVAQSPDFFEQKNNTNNSTDKNTDMEGPSDATSKAMKACVYFMVIFCTGQIFKECIQIKNQRTKYFQDYINYLEWGLYTTTLVYVLPFLITTPMVVGDSQRQCSAVAVFLGWMIFLMYQQRIDVIGIYVVMFHVILKTLVRVLLVFMGLFVAFAMALFILMKDEKNHAFQTVPISLFRVFTMTMAEIDFINSFVGPSTDNDQETMPFMDITFFFLGCLIIFLPIIFMNLMIGLAVGDIASVQKDANLKRLAMQVEVYTEMEQKIPARILEYVDKSYVVLFPNIKCKHLRSSARKKWMNSRICKCDIDADEQMTGIKGLPGNDRHDNSEMTSLKKKMTSLSSQMEKQYDILRLIMQKMEISIEADDQDEGMAPPMDTCGNPRFDFSQVVQAAARNQPRIQRASIEGPPDPSV